jgi:hypothetical protein
MDLRTFSFIDLTHYIGRALLIARGIRSGNWSEPSYSSRLIRAARRNPATSPMYPGPRCQHQDQVADQVAAFVGFAVNHCYCPPNTVIGELDQASKDLFTGLYAAMRAPVLRADVRNAVNSVENSWHAPRIEVAHGIRNVCKFSIPTLTRS